ncbi:hypothetical protein HC776_00935 [bacterium]|nr:hypothetical protein [bacterium]
MNESDTLQNATGITSFQAMDLGTQVAIAVQVTLILFFIISPMMGYVLAQGIKDRTRVVIGVGIRHGLIVMGGNVALDAAAGPHAAIRDAA